MFRRDSVRDMKFAFAEFEPQGLPGNSQHLRGHLPVSASVFHDPRQRMPIQFTVQVGIEIVRCRTEAFAQEIVVEPRWQLSGKRFGRSNDQSLESLNRRSNSLPPGHTAEVDSVAWSGDGKRLASASGDQTIKLWNATTGALQLTLSGHTSWLDSLSWSPDGSRLASGSSDDSVKLWDTSTGTEVVTFNCPSIVHAVAWSPNGRTLASAEGDGLVRIYDATAGYAAANQASANSGQ